MAQQIPYDVAMALAMMAKAINGDAKAFEVVRDTLGQMPRPQEEDKSDKLKELTDTIRAAVKK